jgi:glutamyl-tRNA synthetase
MKVEAHKRRIEMVLTVEGPGVGGPCGPYRQSERSELYREHAAQLLHTGKAYRCFCTHEQLQEKAAARTVSGQGSEYDGTCYGISKTESDERAANGESFIVRMMDPHRFPEKMTQWVDLVRGVMKPRMMPKQRSGLEVYDDAILLKGDGLPTYHLANVVDDQLMKITHVIRGVEWLESTWKHVALYEAFGWERPEFAHVGLLRDAEGKKLSKRERQYDFDTLKQTVLPEALMNFLALLGWRHEGSKKEVASMEQLLALVSDSLWRYAC